MSRHKKARRSAKATPPSQPGQDRPEQPGPQDRRHQTVTALLLTAEEFPGELGESFAAACAAVGVKPVTPGYGLVLAQDDHGGRWTEVTTDARGVSSTQSIWHMGLERGYEPPDGSVVAVRPGWPVRCGLGLAGLGEPTTHLTLVTPCCARRAARRDGAAAWPTSSTVN